MIKTVLKFPDFLTRYRIVRRRRLKRGTLKAKKSHYARHKEDARKLVHEKLAYHNAHYGFKWGRVAIKNMRSRWGSCSSKGNLNFHYRVLFLPEKHLDYVIVHELCHLKEFNHSKKFWDLVTEKVPDHKTIRKRMRKVLPTNPS